MCVSVKVFASEPVLWGVQRCAPRFWAVMILVFGTQREGIPSDLDRDRGAPCWCVIIYSAKWAAAEGDSVSGGNGTGRISPSN